MPRYRNDIESIIKSIIANTAIITDVKCTTIVYIGNDDMEGTRWQVGIKIFTTSKYRNMQYGWLTNSSDLFDKYYNGPAAPSYEDFKKNVLENLDKYLKYVLATNK